MRSALRAAAIFLIAIGVVLALPTTSNADNGLTVAETHVQAQKQQQAAKAHEHAQQQAAQRKAKLERRVLSNGLYNISSIRRGDFALTAGKTATAPTVRNDADWSQKWAVAWDVKTGYYTIRNLNTRKFLSVSGKVNSGAGIRQVAKATSRAQLWEPVRVAGGVVFKSALSDLALTTLSRHGSSTFILYKAHVKAKAKAKVAPAAQTFALNAVEALEVEQTYYVNSVTTGKRLHVCGDSREDGVHLELWAPSAQKSQKFRLLRSGTAYRLQNVSSCYYMGSYPAGVGAVRQLASKAGNLSRWDIRLNYKEAAFTISSRLSGAQLDGTAGGLELKYERNTSGQLFTFARTHAFRLYLNPGHGWNDYDNGAWDTGAVGSGHEEAEFSHDLARRVETLLAGTDVQVINGEQFALPYWERLPKAVSLGCDAIVSIHFDIGGGSGTLKMVGVQEKAPGSEELAQAIHERIVASLGLRDRGPSERSDITCVNGPIPSMLTEICFMDNLNDVETYLEHRDDVARAIADGIVAASRMREVLR